MNSAARTTPFQEALGVCLVKKLTFAAFRIPGKAFELHVQEHAAPKLFNLPDLPTQSGFIVIPFRSDRSAGALIRKEITIQEHDKTLPAGLASCIGSPEPTEKVPPLFETKEAYVDSVQKAVDHINKGALHKVVLSRREQIAVTTDDLPGLLMTAAEAYPDALVHLHHTPQFGTWLGASPERLLELRGDTIEVDSIAGTMPTHEQRWNAKEEREQALVTDHVLAVFNDLNLSQITTKGPDLLQAGPVTHLHTTINASLATIPLGKAIQALHPTPAVAGTPCNAALKWIEQNEHRDRSLYAGVVGPCDQHQASLYVNIRCLEMLSTHGALHVGGGITAESDPQQEWTETEQKADTWKRLVNGPHAKPSRTTA